jgi:hypothetical protein
MGKMANRRGRDRILCSWLVSIRPADGRHAWVVGVVWDINAVGISVQLDQPWPLVEVEIKPYETKNAIKGIVRHSTCEQGDWIVGIEFKDFTWDARLGWPQHLLRPTQLFASFHPVH